MSHDTLEKLNNDFDQLGDNLKRLFLILEDLYQIDSLTDTPKNNLQSNFKKDENRFPSTNIMLTKTDNQFAKPIKPKIQQQTTKEGKITNNSKRQPSRNDKNIKKNQQQTTTKGEKTANKPNMQPSKGEKTTNNLNIQPSKEGKTTNKPNIQSNKEGNIINKPNIVLNKEEKTTNKVNIQSNKEDKTTNKPNVRPKKEEKTIKQIEHHSKEEKTANRPKLSPSKEEKTKNRLNIQPNKKEKTTTKTNMQPNKERKTTNKPKVSPRKEDKTTNKPSTQSNKEEKITNKLSTQSNKEEKTTNKPSTKSNKEEKISNKQTNISEKIEKQTINQEYQRSLHIKKFIDENPDLNFALIGDVIRDLSVSSRKSQRNNDIVSFLVSKYINDDLLSKQDLEKSFYEDDKENEVNRSNLQSFIDSLINQKVDFSVSAKYVKWICKSIIPVFFSELSLLELEPPIYICGDIHGHFDDLLTVFEKGGFPPKSTYLFLGDYVDRGDKSVDVICLLFALKLLYPKNIYILRGNHEYYGMNCMYGFGFECEKKFDKSMWVIFNKVFDAIPIAAVVGKQYFCVHGGLSPSLQNVNDINNIKRPAYIEDNEILHDILWSDPSEFFDGWKPNPRGGNTLTYGKDVAELFLKQNKIQYIVRGHEIAVNGFNFPFNPVKNTITVFTASDYEFHSNQAAIMFIDSDKNFSFITWRKMFKFSPFY